MFRADRLCRLLVAAVLLSCPLVHGQESRVSLDEMLRTRDRLRLDRPTYRNYAFESYVNYPDHSLPYTDQPRSYYGSLGNFLLSGYELYSWREDRVPGRTYGSGIFKDFNPWVAAFDNMAMGRDGYGNWGYSLIVGDAQVARFTPLTISMANFNGVRFDLTFSPLERHGPGVAHRAASLLRGNDPYMVDRQYPFCRRQHFAAGLADSNGAGQSLPRSQWCKPARVPEHAAGQLAEGKAAARNGADKLGSGAIYRRLPRRWRGWAGRAGRPPDRQRRRTGRHAAGGHQTRQGHRHTGRQHFPLNRRISTAELHDLHRLLPEPTKVLPRSAGGPSLW